MEIVQWNMLKWFESYLANRKQYIQIDTETKTALQEVTCGVPQGSILGPLLFLIYVMDLQYASHLLQPIMFADDDNLFYAERDIKKLLQRVNIELNKISHWFISNKLSINVTKTKHSFFHKPSKRDDIPLALPNYTLTITRFNDESIKFLGVFLDEDVTCKEHIKYIVNKIAKNIGITF